MLPQPRSVIITAKVWTTLTTRWSTVATHCNSLATHCYIPCVTTAPFGYYNGRGVQHMCNTLQHTCKALQHNCNSLQHFMCYHRSSQWLQWSMCQCDCITFATRCNTWQQTCNTLQRTATHCNTLNILEHYFTATVWEYTRIYTHTLTKKPSKSSVNLVEVFLHSWKSPKVIYWLHFLLTTFTTDYKVPCIFGTSLSALMAEPCHTANFLRVQQKPI